MRVNITNIDDKRSTETRLHGTMMLDGSPFIYHMTARNSFLWDLEVIHNSGEVLTAVLFHNNQSTVVMKLQEVYNNQMEMVNKDILSIGRAIVKGHGQTTTE